MALLPVMPARRFASEGTHCAESLMTLRGIAPPAIELIGLWQRVRDGFPYTLAELDGPVSVVSTVVELP